MITFSRVASVQAGQMGPAMAFAQEIAAYIKEMHGTVLEISVPIGGNPNRIAWTARYPGLADMEAAQVKMLNDAKYQQIVARAANLLISGATRDTIWRSV